VRAPLLPIDVWNIHRLVEDAAADLPDRLTRGRNEP